MRCPVYDFTIHDRSDETELIKPSKVLIVEGILIFADKRLRDEMDIKIYVDTDADVRILRRILRDVKKRGRSLDSVVEQYLNTVKPMHEQFVEPSKKNADIIIPERSNPVINFLLRPIKLIFYTLGILTGTSVPLSNSLFTVIPYSEP